MERRFLLVDVSVLPEVFLKVLKAKELLAAGSAFLGNFYTGVAPGDLLVQVVHDVLLALLIGLVKFQQALA